MLVGVFGYIGGWLVYVLEVVEKGLKLYLEKDFVLIKYFVCGGKFCSGMLI